MPEKDYTDYVCLILEAKKRVYHIIHVRSTPDLKLEKINHNGHRFVFDRDRAFLLKKWRPWKMLDIKHPLKCINELLRAKKVGLLLYHEPINPKPLTRQITTKVPKEYVCKECAFTTATERGIKVHLSRRHHIKDPEGHVRIEYTEHVETQTYFEAIEPIHTSRIHQPSGRLVESVAEVKAVT